MSVHFSQLVTAHERGNRDFAIRALDLRALGERASPVTVVDDFRVRGRPFEPHPHAGFSAVTYVFEDSAGSLRSRDSLGNDVVVGPGGIVWTQAGSGVIHHEVPAETDRELHGLQLFVNLSSKSKLVGPRMFRLQKDEVPEWHNESGDRVRVVVGTFKGIASPLRPAEPFDFLDVKLEREISLHLRAAHNALVYVVKGRVLVRADGREQPIPDGHALALYGDGGRAVAEALEPAQFFVLSGKEIVEPILVDGPFIMNDRAQIDAAASRYRSGQMGYLPPLP